MNSARPRPHVARRRRRGPWRAVTMLAIAYIASTALGCMNPSTPFDLALNLAPAPSYPELARDPNSATRPVLVVLQHGICRSAWSLWRLERALESQGYEVFNPSYASTQHTIESHAAELARRLETHLANRRGATPDLVFVGHSMGGLVIRAYLAREGARPAARCIFIGVPHRGAVLMEKRKSLLAFRMFLGDRAALQLELGHPFYDSLGPVPCPSIGCIFGGKGDEHGWNDDIPGDDDGTVGVAEAQLDGQHDAIRLRLGHTRIGFAAPTIEQVLHFLANGRFRHTRD